MRSLKRRLGAVLMCCAPWPAAAEDESLRYLDVCLNGRCREAVAVLAIAPGQWWLDSRVLAEAGLDTSDWPERRREGERFVNLLARFPQANVQLDEPTQSLRFTLPGTAWPAREYRPGRASSRPPVPLSSVPSVFINYSLFGSSEQDPSAYVEAGGVRGPWSLRSSVSVDGQGLRRGLSSLEFDQPGHQRRWVLGDQYISGFDPFALTPRVAGLGVYRAYDLTPGFVRYPGADIRGVMQAPGSVEVFANGMLVAREDVAPGPFNLQDLVLTQGSNDLRIVVNDPFVGSYEISGGFYGSPRLLRQGLHEFDDRVGRVAQGDGYRSGPPLVSLKHRYGLSDQLTAGLRYEQLGQRRNLGVSMDLRPRVGSLSLALAQARDGDGHTHGAWRVDYSFQGRRMGFGLGLRRQDAGYRSVLARPSDPASATLERERYAQASWALGRHLSLGARYAQQDYSDGRRSRLSSVNLGWRLGRLRANLGATRRQAQSNAGDEVFLSLQMPLGRDNFSLGARRSRGQDELRFSAQRSPPADQGWGYRVDLARSDEFSTGLFELEQVSRFVRADLRVNLYEDQASADLRYFGGLLWTQGEFFAAQAGTSGYALVSTPGQAGVPVLRENQRIGVTGKDSRLLVPGLLPYQSNLLGIDIRKLDAGQRADQEKAYLSVPRFGVGLVEFPVRRLRALQAYLGERRDGKWQRLDSGEARVAGGDGVSQIGREGQVYFEDIAPGKQVLQVRRGEAVLRCEVEVPAAEPMAWLGEIACTPP